MMHKSLLLFDGDDGTILRPDAGHVLAAGRSGTGKTIAAALFARARLLDPRWGLHVVDPEGDLSPLCRDFVVNPSNGVSWRKVHYLRPASTDAFALPVLSVPDRAPQPCHEVSVRALSIFAQAGSFDAGDYGPRLTKFFYLGLLGLALTGRPLVDLPDLYSLGAAHLRHLIADAYPYAFLADEIKSLDLLSDRAFLEYRDPLISRLLPIFGNPQLRRVFGPQRPIDLTEILARREVVLLDLSNLEHKDAVLVGRMYLSLFYHHAVQRPANTAAHASMIIDEAFDYLAPMARGFDRLRKRNVQLLILIQRLAQIAKAVDEDSVAMLSAAITNTTTKICFGGLEPDDCELMVRLLFSSSVDLQEWKEKSARPVAVGNRKEIVRSRSRAQHEAEHQTHATTRSNSHGEAIGTMSSTSMSAGDFSASGDSAGLVMQAPAQLFGPSAPNAQMLPVPLTQNTGESSSRGSSEMTSTSTGSSRVSVDMYGEAETVGYGTSRGTSVSEGESETFVTQYEWMPTQFYSLPEQLFRLAGELMNLPRRECFVKIGENKPFRTRTAQLQPAFKSHFAKRVMLPIFQKTALAKSPYLLPVADVDAQIAARLAPLKALATPEPDFTKPEPVPASIVDAPEQFGTDFWRKRKPPGPDDDPPKPKPKKPKGRRPVGDLDGRHDRFRVVPGGKADGDNGT